MAAGETDAAGLINLSEHQRAQGFGPNVTDNISSMVANTIIRSDKKRLVPMTFGYSDYLWIYLNGKLLYRGENSFRENDRRIQALVTRYDEIVLNLKKEPSELVLIL